MERILVVEDEASIRKALQMGLASKDFEVDLASDGINGILLGRQKSYDILITDLCLPDINGLEVIEKIKQSSPEIIPIVITGKGDMQSSLEAIRLEVSDYLEKPLSLESLKNSIARGLERRAVKRKAVEEQLHHQALYDSLTTLPNRVLFIERLERAIARARRRNDYLFAVLLIDIDRFKSINDGHGHLIGDKVLIELSNRFKESIRTVDTVARMNGDDFAILIEEFTCSQQVMNIAERVQKTAKQPISINSIEAHISASIGIVVKTKSYKSPENILRDAEIALYRSKEMGRGLIKVFDKKMLKLAVESMQIENDLRIGIQNQDFFLYYQPIIHVDSQRLAGLEALIRWNHPVQGIISPVKFIPIAEETGLINPIGKWVISEACRQLKEWKRTLSGSENLTLNVNISGKQLLQKDLANFVAGVLHENCLDPRHLKFELTESVLMNDSKTAIKILNDLKNIGIKLVIDDFGTGYSSLSYLKQFPLDDLKIGRFFIRGLGVDEECIEIVKTIVALAKNLELNVVAEGVDREEQLFILKDLYCDMVQGHLFSEPVDKNSATKLINNFI